MNKKYYIRCSQTALTLLLNWSAKCDAMFERSKKVIPVHLRTKKLDYHIPVKALANYKTNEVCGVFKSVT
jgi:hypothetical protein